MDSEEEEHVQVRQKKHMDVEPVAQADFEHGFRTIMQESLKSLKSDSWKHPMLNMVIPTRLFGGSK